MTGVPVIRRARTAAAIVLIGVATGFAAFQLTAVHESHRYFGLICQVDAYGPGFDPWTGLPVGRTVVMQCPESFEGVSHSRRVVVGEVPPDMAGRRAIPFPFGFGAGVLVATAVAAWRNRLTRLTATGAL